MATSTPPAQDPDPTDPPPEAEPTATPPPAEPTVRLIRITSPITFGDFAAKYNTDEIQFVLAAGNSGIESATNIVVSKAQYQMLALVYGVVALLVLLTFRSWRAVVCIIVPLALTTVVAQALMAASHTVDAAFRLHSLHAYFILGGVPSEPVRYEVDRIRNGRSFATRRVVARQAIGAILNAESSFQRPEVSAEVQTGVVARVPASLR